MNIFEAHVKRRLEKDEFAPGGNDTVQQAIYAQWKSAEGRISKLEFALEAISSQLSCPPLWALLTVWLHRKWQTREVKTGANHEDQTADLLDLTIWQLLDLEESHWHPPDDTKTNRPFERKLAQAMRFARSFYPDSHGLAEVNLRRRWKDEQKAGWDEKNPPITGYRNTERIKRVSTMWIELRSNPDCVPKEYAEVFQLINGVKC